MIQLCYETKKKLKEVAKAIAKAGHDTEFSKAATSTYQQLPMCCLYR